MPPIKHIFVLMLENRSFDHMLGFSGITGADASTGNSTQINGLSGKESNSWNGVPYPITQPALDPMTVDPWHEFTDVLEQLCGHGAKYPSGGPYPPINNSGFVSNFAFCAKSPTPGDVMKCFARPELPVLSALAKEFAVCDNWFCSLPGPTFPNRFFALGASSAELDHSPATAETIVWQTIDGFKFQNGSIFDRKLNWRIYAGNKLFTLAHALKGIHINDITRYARFAKDISDPAYPAQFTWIEPNYGHVLTDYVGGNSQHPKDGVTGGEALIKATYEAIRNSPLWESSMFIITWDEHGGFFDHVAPPRAIPPGDSAQFSKANRFGFAFDVYGPRVPAVVISPLIPRNTIDHRVYDHSSILATVERQFGLPPLTKRDAGALDLRSLASLPVARTDAPAVIGIESTELLNRAASLDTLQTPLPPASRENDPIEDGVQFSLPGFLYVAARTDAELPPENVALESFTAGVRGRLATRRDARDYLEEVRRKTVANESGNQ
jgi:phospholipase C